MCPNNTHVITLKSPCVQWENFVLRNAILKMHMSVCLYFLCEHCGDFGALEGYPEVTHEIMLVHPCD